MKFSPLHSTKVFDTESGMLSHLINFGAPISTFKFSIVLITIDAGKLYLALIAAELRLQFSITLKVGAFFHELK